MTDVIEKKDLHVNANFLTPLLRGLSSKLDIHTCQLETAKTKFTIQYRNEDADIGGSYTLFDRDMFEVVGGAIKKYSLEINQRIGFKVAGDVAVKDKFIGKEYIFPIPTIWFSINLAKKPFLAYVKELNEAYQSMPHKEDVLLNENNEPVLVLRPGNLTHSVLAFRVERPELFRQALFEIILIEIGKLWEARRDFKFIGNYQKVVEKNIKDCGLGVISNNTFGMDGVYSEKTDGYDPSGWGLSVFIKGKDVRTVKYGEKLFIHDDWDVVQKKGGSIIHPIDVDTLIGGDKKAAEFKDLMDNKATPICGSVDYRKPDFVHRYYFMETSPNFSSEYYSEEFALSSMHHTLTRLEELHEQYIGNKNDDLAERREKHFDALKKEADTFNKPLDSWNETNETAEALFTNVECK